MRINVVKAEDGVFYDFQGVVTLPDGLIADRFAKYVGSTLIEGRYVMTDGDVIVYAKCLTKVEFACDKCLKKIVRDVVYRLAASYSLQPKEGFAYTYSGNCVSLDDALAEEFCLAMPTQTLCSDDCRGLCPVCGANLNDEECDCEVEYEESPKGNPFAGLKDVFKD